MRLKYNFIKTQQTISEAPLPLIIQQRGATIKINFANAMINFIRFTKEEAVVQKEIRTPRGKLIGTFDDGTSILTIKDGKKLTQIKVPPTGLSLIHTFSDGVTEEVSIKIMNNPKAA